MADREIAKWIVEMVDLAKQLPDDYLQDWKDIAREMILPKRWDNAEKWIDVIWKCRTLEDEALLKLKKALEEAGTSTKAR